MKTKKLYVLPYDSQWKQDFEEIRRELADALGVSADYLLTGKPLVEADRDAIARAASAAKPMRGGGLSKEELSVLVAAMLTES